MLNQAIIVGTIDSINTKKNMIVIACTRNYRDNEGNYETDYFNIFFDDALASGFDRFKLNEILAIKAMLIQPRGPKHPYILAQKYSLISRPEEGTHGN
jgi:hypothetical protein